MFFLKYGVFALTLLIWFAGASSVDLNSESMQGDREKRTLVLGVLFKKLLLQQALARNNMRMMNSTAMMSPQQMMAAASSSTSPAPEQSPAPPQPAPPQMPPQPAQSSPTPEATSQQPPPPALSMPQGIRTPPAQPVPQGPPPVQRILPTAQGFPSLNVFNPTQQQLLFPANYPFGVQRFRQLPFGPAPPLGAQAGPQRFSNYYPFNLQNGYFQNIGLQPSFQQSIGTPGSPPQITSQASGPQNFQSASQQQVVDNGPPQGQAPPAEVGSSEQSPPSAPVPSDLGGPPQGTQISSGSQQSQASESSAPAQEIPSPTSLGGEADQGLPSNAQQDASQQPATNPPEPQPSQIPAGGDELQQNFQFGPLPPQAAGGGGSQPDFSLGQQQNPNTSNGQETQPPEQQGPLTDFSPQSLDNNLQQQFGNQLQQQLSNNGLPSSNPNNIPQNFASPNGSPQSGQPDNSFFNLPQFAGTDNSVFDFSQEGGTSPNAQQLQQQQQTQQESFQNGLFAPSGQEQFSSINDPRSNFAFRGQQLDFSSPFQDSGNFQRNFFQQNLF